MQTYIVIVFEVYILNISTVHLNGIWHLIWRYLSKPVFGGHPVLADTTAFPSAVASMRPTEALALACEQALTPLD